jgi:hypothetical protein
VGRQRRHVGRRLGARRPVRHVLRHQRHSLGVYDQRYDTIEGRQGV